ncbi:MAG: alpha/beta hydrolase [Alphaproteobacteria bacterium]
MVQYLKRNDKPDLAYIYSEGENTALPIVIFCGGYASDMQGTKAVYFENACKARGQSYLRFDYSGHGQSGGAFADGTIGTWAADALAIFDHIVKDHWCVIVGSSMGGWIGLLLANKREEQLAGYIGIAAAPDFTEELFHERLNNEQRETVMQDGRVLIPNDYSDDPYVFTRELFEDGKENCLLRDKHVPSYPMHLFQGMEDNDVHPDTANAIQKAYGGGVEITFIKDGDHRLSRPQDLEAIERVIEYFSVV